MLHYLAVIVSHLHPPDLLQKGGPGTHAHKSKHEPLPPSILNLTLRYALPSRKCSPPPLQPCTSFVLSSPLGCWKKPAVWCAVWSPKLPDLTDILLEVGGILCFLKYKGFRFRVGSFKVDRVRCDMLYVMLELRCVKYYADSLLGDSDLSEV